MCLPEDWLNLNKIGFLFFFFSQSGSKIRYHGSTMSFQFQTRQGFPGLISQVLPRVFPGISGSQQKEFSPKWDNLLLSMNDPHSHSAKAAAKSSHLLGYLRVTVLIKSYWIVLWNARYRELVKKETNIKFGIRMTSFFFKVCLEHY